MTSTLNYLPGETIHGFPVSNTPVWDMPVGTVFGVRGAAYLWRHLGEGEVAVWPTGTITQWQGLDAHFAILEDPNDTPADEPAPGVAALAERIRQLEAELTRAKERHASDIATIGNSLIDEATSRDWCSEYDDIVAGINRDLYVDLPVRARPRQVTFVAELTDEQVSNLEEWIDAMLLANDVGACHGFDVDLG